MTIKELLDICKEKNIDYDYKICMPYSETHLLSIESVLFDVGNKLAILGREKDLREILERSEDE